MDFNVVKRKLLAASAIMPAPVHGEKQFLDTVLTYRTLSSVAVHHKYRLVYFRIPKAANSTILSGMHELFEGRPLEVWNREDLTKRYFSPLGGSNIFRSKRVINDYLFFSFVRNPYSRILSAYLQKFKVPSVRRRFPDVPSSQSRDPREGFCIFLEKLQEKYLYSDHHWIPQVDFVWPNIARLDFLGRVETLQESFDALVARLAVNNRVSPRVDLSKYQGVGSSTTGAGELVQHYYSSNSTAVRCRYLVESIYGADFQAFDYAPGMISP